MRLLFNHGLTVGELFTNTPKRVSDRKWRWLIKHYGWTDSYENAISGPFKYCLGLIFNRIIEEKKRFIIPYASDTYIDFEIVSGNDFLLQRQNGRFQEIDIVSSDFSGYALQYFYKNKAYNKILKIYLGGDLKKLFLNNINEGVKFYSTKDLTIDDFIEDVHKEYNKHDIQEIKRILIHGFRRMQSAIKNGCAITIISKKHINCYVHMGNISLNVSQQLKDYSIRRDKKLRKIETWKKLDFDGYYYIGLNPTKMKEWLSDNEKSRTLVKFNNVIPRKIEKELYYKYRDVFIFRINIKKFKGWAFWGDELKCKNVHFVGEVHSLKFTKSDETWKELRESYEKREC